VVSLGKRGALAVARLGGGGSGSGDGGGGGGGGDTETVTARQDCVVL
jgi:hypothetical protein